MQTVYTVTTLNSSTGHEAGGVKSRSSRRMTMINRLVLIMSRMTMTNRIGDIRRKHEDEGKEAVEESGYDCS